MPDIPTTLQLPSWCLDWQQTKVKSSLVRRDFLPVAEMDKIGILDGPLYHASSL